MTLLSTIQHFAANIVDLASMLVTDGDGNFGQDTQDAIDFADSEGAFTVVQNVFRVVGIGVVVWTAKGVITALIGAKYPDAAKKLIGGIIAAVLCFRLSLPLGLVEGIGNLLEKVFSSFNNVLQDE